MFEKAIKRTDVFLAKLSSLSRLKRTDDAELINTTTDTVQTHLPDTSGWFVLLRKRENRVNTCQK